MNRNIFAILMCLIALYVMQGCNNSGPKIDSHTETKQIIQNKFPNCRIYQLHEESDCYWYVVDSNRVLFKVETSGTNITSIKQYLEQ